MKKTTKLILTIIIICAALVLGADVLVVESTYRTVYDNQAQMEKMSDLASFKPGEADCILILGCGVHDDGTPTDMLRDRLETGMDLYRDGVAKKILISGDNGQIAYNEIHVMLHYLLDNNIPAEDIFCDHAGFSTYDSVYRAKSIFGVKRMVVVTQKYHQYRAQFIASRLGIESIGCCTEDIKYKGWVYRDIREIAARDKDCLKAFFKPESTYGGDPISLSGDSKLSWEESEL